MNRYTDCRKIDTHHSTYIFLTPIIITLFSLQQQTKICSYSLNLAIEEITFPRLSFHMVPATQFYAVLNAGLNAITYNCPPDSRQKLIPRADTEGTSLMQEPRSETPFSTTSGMVPPGAQFNYKWRWPAMVVLLSASFMNLLDVSIVNVALPDIQKNFSANNPQIEWVVAAYILAFALGLLPLGRLGDRVGRKRMFNAGVAGFTLSSFICAWAGSIHLLILGRTLQGLTAAMLAPQVMAIAQTLFAPKDRPVAFSLFGMVAGLASVVGPSISGLLVHANFLESGWRTIFLINLPIGLFTLLAAARWLPAIPAHTDIRVDWPGIGLAATALFCLIFPLIEGRSHNWHSGYIVIIIGGVLLMLFFIHWQRRQAGRSRPVLLPFYLMHNRDYRLGSLAIAVLFSSLQGFFLVFTLFLQQGMGWSALTTGLATTPFAIGVAIVSLFARHITSLQVKILVGILLQTGCYCMLWFIVNGNDGSMQPWALTLPLLMGGVGFGLAIASLFQTVMRTVPLKDAGAGSGALQVIQNVGGLLGIALVSQLFFSNISFFLQQQTDSVIAFTKAFISTVPYYLMANLIVACFAFRLK